jgi:hypothetical protein
MTKTMTIATLGLALALTAAACGSTVHAATPPATTRATTTTPGTTPIAATPTTKAVPVTPAPTTPPTTTAGLADKGWTVVPGSVIVANDGVGDFGGTMRVTNTNSSSKTATFTLTVFRGAVQVAALEGSADAVSAGQTVTVQLISQNPYSTGPMRYAFQTDFSF